MKEHIYSQLNFKIMGSYSKGANGTISGKFGSVVASTWRGIDYLRGLPKKKKDRQPSANQLAVQAKFALAAAHLSPIKDILTIGFGDKKLTKITGYNAAVSNFLTEVVEGDYPDFVVNYAKMRISMGSLRYLKHVSMSINDNLLTVAWPFDQAERDSFTDDRVTVVVYNETTALYDVNETAHRGDGEAILNLDFSEEDVLHVWVFCVKRDGLKVSKSQYLGSLPLQPS